LAEEDFTNMHEILTQAVVSIHNSVDKANQGLKRAGKRYNFITPRDYLDFINHFVRLSGEKREEIQSQKQHLSGGLNKLKETEIQVEELRKGLVRRISG
jgi:dynein heavy chain 1, cytosolic